MPSAPDPASTGVAPPRDPADELKLQRERFGPLLDVSPSATVMTDLEGTVVAWNQAAEHLFGYSESEALGRQVDDLIADRKELRSEAAAYTKQALAGVRATTRRTRKDGTLVEVELRGAPLTGSSGATIGTFAVYHDITELQQQRRYYGSLVEISPTAIVTIDVDANITAWNRAAEHLFGYTQEEAIGRNIDDLVAPTELHAEATAYSDQAADESIKAITQRARKDGSLVDVELLAAPIMAGNEHVATFALYHDVTELQSARHEAEAANHAKSSFLATMSHEIRTPMNAVIGMAAILLDTPLSREQRHYAEIIRSSADTLLTIINDILDFSKIEAGHLELERESFDLRTCIESALDLVAPKASEKSLDLAYVLDPEAPAAIFGDVTRLRQVLVNLLNNGVKFTEGGEVVLEVDALPCGPGDPASESLQLHFKVRDTGSGIPADQLDRLFESFSQLDTSTTRRFGGTGLGLSISKRLAELMGGTVWAESEVGRGSTFHFTIETGAAPTEARDYLTEPHADLEGRNVLVVDDNPTNRDILTHLLGSWQMGVREAASPSEALRLIVSGEPFDLAILDMQMPDMDGAMLASEIRKHRSGEQLPFMMLTSLGREFALDGRDFVAYLTKPLKPSQLHDALTEVFGSERTADSGWVPGFNAEQAERLPLRLLLAEDNEVNQQIACLHLEKLGYRTDVVSNGVEAIEALRRQTYDVVLMDVQMPELDGLEATRRIRRDWPEGGPRIIAMTANAMEGDREACLAAGMDDYVSKPIRMEELASALSRSQPAPTPIDGNAGALLDRDALARLADLAGGWEGLTGIIDIFLRDAPRLVTALRSSLESRDETELRRVAHTLKSNAETFGSKELAVLCREMEKAAAVGSFDEVAELVARIEPLLDVVRGALEDERGRIRS